MPRFVLLHHVCPPGYERPTHWDLMLEEGDRLRTWALTELPADGAPCEAELLADHRLAYLELEGPLSGDRGSVRRHDEGTYRVVADSAGRLVVDLVGAKLSGRATLEQIDAEAQRWRFSLDII